MTDEVLSFLPIIQMLGLVYYYSRAPFQQCKVLWDMVRGKRWEHHWIGATGGGVEWVQCPWSVAPWSQCWQWSRQYFHLNGDGITEVSCCPPRLLLLSPIRVLTATRCLCCHNQASSVAEDAKNPFFTNS